MQDFLNKKILVGISGGIAAYKIAYLVRELTRLGAIVRVVMTKSAQQFITPMTMQALSGNEVRCELFDPQAERAMGHIELARWADYLVIAPASANCIAKMAQGMADDLLSTLYLVTETPVIVCPAMNRSMWNHIATKSNIDILKQHGVIILGPAEGSQACGEYGFGRMVEIETIINGLRLGEIHQQLAGRQLLITAGPTREPIDPVRYITNCSSGKMGYAIAEAARLAGAEVTLISGPTALNPPLGVRYVKVETAVEMCNKVMDYLEPGMIFIGTAAVADFGVENFFPHKIKRLEKKSMQLELVANPDILSTVVASKKAAYTVGFAAETHDVLKNAREKLAKKNVDMIIANEVGPDKAFDRDENQAIVITKEQEIELEVCHKIRLAAQIIAILAQKLQN